MKVHFYGVPKDKESKIVSEGVYKGVRYTIKEVEVDNDTNKNEPEKEKD